MAQFGRPSTDANLGNWTDEGAGTTTIYDGIDEITAEDTEKIISGLAPSSDPYVTKLTTVEDPQSSTGHTVRFRYQKNSSGGAQINLTVELRQGYVSEGSPGTLIATVATLTNISNGWTTGSYTLSGAEADAITDYSDLYLRFVATQV